MLLDDFVKALEIADITVLTDIMGSREKNTIGIYSKDLGEKIPGCIWFDSDKEVQDAQTSEQKNKNFDQVIDYLCENAKEGDFVITLGCGDVYKVAKKLAQKLKEKSK